MPDSEEYIFKDEQVEVKGCLLTF